MRRHLGITLEPIRDDPLLPPNGRQPWEPRPLDLAKTRFLAGLERLAAAHAKRRRRRLYTADH
jgi:hypothetical protein